MPNRPGLAGTSLHTGGAVTLTMKPAPIRHGLKFRRMDIEDQPFIAASVDKVQMVERANPRSSSARLRWIRRDAAG